MHYLMRHALIWEVWILICFFPKTWGLSRIATKYVMNFIENLFLLRNSSAKQRKLLKGVSYRIYSGGGGGPQFHQATKILSPYCWSRGLRRGSAATRLLGLRVRIPPEACMSFAFECYVLSCRGLWDGPITHLEESYRVCCFWMWSWNLSKEE